MAEIEIKGNNKYVSSLSKHLLKTHPSTKGRLKVELDGCFKKKRKSSIGKKKCNSSICQAKRMTKINPGF